MRRLKETFDEGGLTPVGRVYASRSTSSQDIKAVLQEFADAGFDKVDFYGGDSETTKRLPFPDSAEH